MLSASLLSFLSLSPCLQCLSMRMHRWELVFPNRRRSPLGSGRSRSPSVSGWLPYICNSRAKITSNYNTLELINKYHRRGVFRKCHSVTEWNNSRRMTVYLLKAKNKSAPATKQHSSTIRLRENGGKDSPPTPWRQTRRRLVWQGDAAAMGAFNLELIPPQGSGLGKPGADRGPREKGGWSGSGPRASLWRQR